MVGGLRRAAIGQLPYLLGQRPAWLSAFPGERECLFPPLTFLSPTGRVQKVGETFTVIEVTPRL